MVLVPRMTADETSWHILPVEIRLVILEALLQTDCSLASCATVYREWREVMERHNFSRIKLTIPRLGEFDSMTRRNQIHVRYIWVCLELQEYRCAESAPLEHTQQGMSNTDSTVIKTAFEDLSETLKHVGCKGQLGARYQHPLTQRFGALAQVSCL